MNTYLLSFCLFLVWFGVALFIFAIGPVVYPQWFQDSSRWQYLGYGAILMALWNLVKWWLLRQYARQRARRDDLEEAFRRRRKPLADDGEKPIVCPEFQFEEDRTRLPPPPPPNGTSH